MFFRHINDDEGIVCPLDNAWGQNKLSKQLKKISDAAKAAMKSAKEELGDKVGEAEWKRAKDTFWKELSSVFKKNRIKAKLYNFLGTIYSLYKGLKL